VYNKVYNAHKMSVKSAESESLTGDTWRAGIKNCSKVSFQTAFEID